MAPPNLEENPDFLTVLEPPKLELAGDLDTQPGLARVLVYLGLACNKRIRSHLIVDSTFYQLRTDTKPEIILSTLLEFYPTHARLMSLDTRAFLSCSQCLWLQLRLLSRGLSKKKGRNKFFGPKIRAGSAIFA